MIHLGNVPASTTVYIPFSTYAGATGASVTCSGLAVTDVEIYKNGSVTQRASDAGIALLDTDGIDFDGITGLHGFSIDLSDNTDAGFYAVGSWYWVVVSAITVDSQTVTFLAATFRIGPAETLTGYPKTDVHALKGDATSATDLQDFADAGYDPATNKVQGVVLVDTATTLTNLPAITANWFTTAGIADGALTAAKFAAASLNGKGDWNVGKTGYTLTATTGLGNQTANITGTVSGNSTHSAADVWASGTRTLTGFGFTVTTSDAASIAAILTDTNELQTDWVDGGRLDLILDSVFAKVEAFDGAVRVAKGSVNAQNTATSFGVSIAGATGKWDDMLLLITTGACAGEAKPILSYVDAGNVITVSEPFSSVPQDGDGVTILAQHIHPALTAAQVNAEVLDVLQTDTFAELGAVPAATSSLKDKITWLFMWFRNKSTETATQRKLYADDATTLVSTETVSDDGTTFTKGEAS